MVSEVAREEAEIFTRLLPIRIALSIFCGCSMIFSIVWALLFPSSARDRMRILLAVVIAVSAEEKKAERRSRSSSTDISVMSAVDKTSSPLMIRVMSGQRNDPE
jgi:hypothetical protein